MFWLIRKFIFNEAVLSRGLESIFSSTLQDVLYLPYINSYFTVNIYVTMIKIIWPDVQVKEKKSRLISGI